MININILKDTVDQLQKIGIAILNAKGVDTMKLENFDNITIYTAPTGIEADVNFSKNVGGVEYEQFATITEEDMQLHILDVYNKYKRIEDERVAEAQRIRAEFEAIISKSKSDGEYDLYLKLKEKYEGK